MLITYLIKNASGFENAGKKNTYIRCWPIAGFQKNKKNSIYSFLVYLIENQQLLFKKAKLMLLLFRNSAK